MFQWMKSLEKEFDGLVTRVKLLREVLSEEKDLLSCWDDLTDEDLKPNGRPEAGVF